ASYDVSFYIRAAYSSEWIIPVGYSAASGEFTSTKSMMTAGGVGYTQVHISLNGSAVHPITPITNEWQKVTVTLTAKNSNALSLVFTEIGGEDNLPYDVAGLSVVESETGTELVTDALKIKSAADSFGWSAKVSGYRGSANIPRDLKLVPSDSQSYNRINASNSGNTELCIVEDGILTSGIYHVSGDFKLADIKSSKLIFGGVGSSWNMPYIVEDNNRVTVSAYYNGEKLTVAGDTAVVTADWSNVSFLLTVPVGESFDMNKITFEFSDSTAVDFKNIEYIPVGGVYVENFVSGDSTPIAIVGENEDKYIHAYDIDFYSDGITYSDPSVTLKEGTSYRLSFSARTMSTLNWHTRFDNGEGYRQIRFFLSSSWSAWLGDDINNRVFTLTDEWAEYSLTFTPTSDSPLAIRIREMGGYDILPYDIKNFSVVEIESGTELVKYGETVSETCGWKNSGASAEVNRTGYYHAYADANGGNTTVNITEEKVLEPGVYYISGKFRLVAPIDFDLINFSSNLTVSSDANGAALSAYVTDSKVQLRTRHGKDSEWIDPYGWTDVKFVIDTSAPIDMNTISFVLDGAYALDFCDVEIELVERKISISEINIGTVVTMLLLKQKWWEDLGLNKLKSNSTASADVVENLIGDAGIEHYLHLSNLRVAGDAAYYRDPSITVTEGETYEISMYVRAAYTSDWYEDYKIGDDFFTKARVRLNGSAPISITRMTNEWTQIRSTVKPTSTGALTFRFEEIGGQDILPYDIAGLSIIKAGTTEQLVNHGTMLASGSDSAGWSTVLSPYRKGSIPSDLKLEAASTGYYNHIPAPKANATEFNIVTNETLTAGTYYVSAGLRLTDYKLSNLEITSFDTGRGFNLDAVMVDNNKTTVSAYYNGEALVTPDGSTTAEITTSWSDVIFAIAVPEGEELQKSDIIFKLGDGVAIDVKNIVFLDESEMSAGLARGVISEEALESWTYGNQTLEYKVDADGTKYLAASNITSNRLGFTYKGETILNPGMYIFSADFRTSTKDETGYVRVVMADTPHTIEISNEWAHMEYVIPVNTAMPLEFKVCGPAIATGIQNYDIANISIINMADTVPNNVNLYEAGSFDDPETALENWATYNGSGALLTYEEDENGGFIRMSNRPNEYCGIILKSDIYQFGGYSYKISYDIRCSNEGESMIARNYTGNFVPLPVNGELFESHNFAFPITDEWRHIEAVITPTSSEKFVIRIAGGFNPDTDLCSFDIDNLSIVKLDN
ncbi:MAG: hypothetical protein IJY93_10410, partial [Clostridia bacterium]|nr:hypothetical protein [Clostridia bacterium]